VTLDKLVPDSLFTEHPEYFALGEDGKRTTDHVCLSNPDVLPVAVENARQAIENCPRESSKHIHIGQKDNENYCHCETCEALYEKYGSVSAPTILFTNAFADALDDDYPDFTFTFYAYNEADRPPADLTLRCSKNVVPVLCGLHKACRSHPLTECGAVDGDDSFNNLFGENEPRIANDFANWVKIADRTYIYDYTINFLNTAQFFSNFGTMQSTMKYMHDTGITGYVYNCGDGHEAAFNELRNYLLCKVQWDVDCDVSRCMNEFLEAYYGKEAAPYIRQILDLQAAQISATAHAFDFDWHYQSGFYAPLTAAKLDSLWKKALAANGTDDQRFNVETANLSWEYFKANLFMGKYTFLNPLRSKANEELYDAFKSHGVNRVCSFGVIPEKSEINFLDRPFNWGR
jgi:ferredoxin